MKSLKKVLKYIAAAVADIVADEPLIVGSVATIGAVWAVGGLGLPKVTVEVIRGAELSGFATLVRHYVTPDRPAFLKVLEPVIEQAAAPVVKKAAKAAPAAAPAAPAAAK